MKDQAREDYDACMAACHGDPEREAACKIEYGRRLSEAIRAKPASFRLSESYAPPLHWPHGTPYRIADEQVDQRDNDQAAAIVAREKTTLDEKESIHNRTHLDELCYRIQVRVFGDDETTLVWYHADTRDFWAYPGAPIPED
jgi:hypothetical protein